MNDETRNDAAMQKELDDKVAALHAADDETRDGKIDLADMKLQLDRIEAQLELQDKQNRTLLHNQKLRFILSFVVIAALCVVVGVLWYHTNIAYQNIEQTCAQVNEIAGTLQQSLDKLDTAELDAMMEDLPAVADKLASVDVDSLNTVLAKLPAIMDSLTALQNQANSLSSFMGNLVGGAG